MKSYAVAGFAMIKQIPRSMMMTFAVKYTPFLFVYQKGTGRGLFCAHRNRLHLHVFAENITTALKKNKQPRLHYT